MLLKVVKMCGLRCVIAIFRLWIFSASSTVRGLRPVTCLRRAVAVFSGDVFDFRATNVQKPRDIITGLKYSNSCRYLLGIRPQSNPSRAG